MKKQMKSISNLMEAAGEEFLLQPSNTVSLLNVRFGAFDAGYREQTIEGFQRRKGGY